MDRCANPIPSAHSPSPDHDSPLNTEGFLLRRLLALVLPVVVLLIPGGIFAQSPQNWIQANASNDWSLTALNWDAGVGWTNGNNAIFAGTGETVELASSVTVNNLTFNSTGYIIADANNDSVLSLGGPSVITVTNGSDTATISELLTVGAITKAGLGTLILSGSNSYSGNTLVNAGQLTVAADTALGNTTGTTTVASGAQVVLNHGFTVTGETISLAGAGTNSTGALQANANASATWAAGRAQARNLAAS
jgi:fibronectin-binding autotransporter adhesin